jgi:hypothetical protein
MRLALFVIVLAVVGCTSAPKPVGKSVVDSRPPVELKKNLQAVYDDPALLKGSLLESDAYVAPQSSGMSKRPSASPAQPEWQSSRPNEAIFWGDRDPGQVTILDAASARRTPAKASP